MLGVGLHTHTHRHRHYLGVAVAVHCRQCSEHRGSPPPSVSIRLDRFPLPLPPSIPSIRPIPLPPPPHHHTTTVLFDVRVQILWRNQAHAQPVGAFLRAPSQKAPISTMQVQDKKNG